MEALFINCPCGSCMIIEMKSLQQFSCGNTLIFCSPRKIVVQLLQHCMTHCIDWMTLSFKIVDNKSATGKKNPSELQPHCQLTVCIIWKLWLVNSNHNNKYIIDQVVVKTYCLCLDIVVLSLVILRCNTLYAFEIVATTFSLKMTTDISIPEKTEQGK